MEARLGQEVNSSCPAKISPECRRQTALVTEQQGLDDGPSSLLVRFVDKSLQFFAKIIEFRPND